MWKILTYSLREDISFIPLTIAAVFFQGYLVCARLFQRAEPFRKNCFLRSCLSVIFPGGSGIYLFTEKKAAPSSGKITEKYGTVLT